MLAMVLRQAHTLLEASELPDPRPGDGEIRIKVLACGVCRTDLHVVDGDLAEPKLPIVPGHEIVGRIDAIGPGVIGLELGARVGVPWLGRTCGVCEPCRRQQENLCDRPLFTGTRATAGSRRRRSPPRARRRSRSRSARPGPAPRATSAPAGSRGAAVLVP
jgi:alcohol dehydrogenase, propanol-preferring